MRCPHCGTTVNIRFEDQFEKAPEVDFPGDEGYGAGIGFCPECSKPVILFYQGVASISFEGVCLDPITSSEIVYPKFPKNRNLDMSIPDKYRTEFNEAEDVLSVSPKASATLSRRLLQMILENELNIKKRNLDDEIAAFSEQANVSSELVKMLTILRKVANFGAHPKKSVNTGEIVEIEDGEAEILLEILYELLDFVFVKPKKLEEFKEHIACKYNIQKDII